MQESGHCHLHINHFGENLPTSVRVLSERYGFLSTLCKIRDKEGALSPLWIVTKKVSARKVAESIFATVVADISRDTEMNGYVECETVPKGSVARFPELSFTPQKNFPISFRPGFRVERTDLGRPILRKADIHIFRKGDLPYDELDLKLKEVGFYEVTTPSQRIWTLLLEDRNSAQLYFDNFKRYFAKAGGASRLELEFVEHLAPTPANFPLLPVVVKDQPPFPAA